MHTKRQYAHCTMDMGHATPRGCSNPGSEGTYPSRCVGSHLHQTPSMHRKLSSLHVDTLWCVLCMQSPPWLLHNWPQMEHWWKLSPSQRQRRVLLCHGPASAWVQRLQLWWLRISYVFLCKSCSLVCLSVLGVLFFVPAIMTKMIVNGVFSMYKKAFLSNKNIVSSSHFRN